MVEIDVVTGEVFSFIDVRRPFATPQAAKVDIDSARAIAAKGTGGRAGAAQLVVSWDRAGDQLLVWQVAVLSPETGGAGQIVVIDAATGAPVDLTQ